ncbi:hypothetical protein [Pseudoalteromonas sp. 2CM28B]|uniref:hypothetical protein n=1 Tax=Pseudoalteromonas sp. 2CM28B TaxID=2929851 RepID=UPI0020C17E28|nr:hypothetical protein [Pseudoalteromonas sp. 2CM28B]MCK8137771.1 hypothetical protein [Pseudoalteromonas sp. 2CM28B]
MIICNGCSKSGTHILTNIAKQSGFEQVGGTLIKRKPNAKMMMKGSMSLEKVLACSNSFYVHSHIAYSQEALKTLEGNKHLFIYRDARNLALSWLRHRNREDSTIAVSTKNLIKLIKGGMFGVSIPDFYSGFINWIADPKTFVISFEEITSGNYSFSKLETFLEVPAGSIDNSIFANSSTKNKVHSNWKDLWSDDVEAAWVEAGGISLEDSIQSLANIRKDS